MAALHQQHHQPLILLDMADLDDADIAAASDSASTTTTLSSTDRRPSSERRSTEPSHSTATLLAMHPRERPRNRSPYGYSRSHLRSQSHASALAPAMARTRSLPSVGFGSSSFGRDSHSPARSASPSSRGSGRQSPRRSFEDGYTPVNVLAQSFMDIASIAEDSELDLNMQATVVPPALHSASFQRSNSGRRRPSSPLSYQLAPPQTLAYSSPAPSQRNLSPSLSNGKFNEPFPTHAPPHPSSASLNTLYSSSSSVSMPGARDSMPSTPTSFRSRSPSVSSLETIPDSPDAEEEAQEAYQLAQLKAAADAAEAEAADAGGLGDRSRSGAGGKSRKRWSVCGAERRADFEMETIWED